MSDDYEEIIIPADRKMSSQEIIDVLKELIRRSKKFLATSLIKEFNNIKKN